MFVQLSGTVAVALTLATHTIKASAASVNYEALFGPYLSSGALIASSNDTDFSTVLGDRWSTWEAPIFTGAIEPATEHDIQEIVKIASAHNIPFLATNGGHGTNINYATVNGLNINLAKFNTVSIDTVNNKLTVGAGVKFGDVVTPLYNAGKEIQTGNDGCVGMIGATVGAGIGIMTSLHGVVLDALESVRLVTAQGDLVTASEQQNPDLFWAIRGAGTNFGIITSATYGIHEQTNDGNVTFADFTYEGSANGSVWELLKSYDDTLPAELSLQVFMSYNRTTNSPLISMMFYYFGPITDAQPHLDKAAALGPIATIITTLTLPEVYASTSSSCDSGDISGATIGLGQTDVPTMEAFYTKLMAFYEANPTYLGNTAFQRYSNGVTLKTPASATSFPWRDIKTFWLHENILTDSSIESAATNLSISLRTLLQSTSGFSTPHIYLNYAMGDEGPAAWWSAGHLAKLRNLKAKWDPKNLFGAGAPMY